MKMQKVRLNVLGIYDYVVNIHETVSQSQYSHHKVPEGGSCIAETISALMFSCQYSLFRSRVLKLVVPCSDSRILWICGMGKPTRSVLWLRARKWIQNCVPLSFFSSNITGGSTLAFKTTCVMAA